MNRRRAVFVLACAAWAGPALAQPDAQRSAWAYRRSLVAADGATAFVSLTLPPELLARCQPQGADLRLLDGQGIEAPYLFDRAGARELEIRYPGTLLDMRRESRRLSAWTVDLGGSRRFDDIALFTPSSDFAKAVSVEVSDDGQNYVRAVTDAALFERPWRDGRLRHTRIDLGRPREARYLRLVADDRRSPAIEVTAVDVALTRPLPGQGWSRGARLEAAAPQDAAGVSRYRLVGVEGLPFESLSLEADDAAFWRNVRVLERAVRNGRAEERTLGEGVLFRLKLEDESLAAESLVLRVQPASGGELLLEVRDGDSPPLRRPRAQLGGAARLLLFPRSAAPLTLYYGNPVTRAPRYDLEPLRARVASGAAAAVALGPEVANPRFQPPPPLAFVPSRGAVLESRLWERERAFSLRGREDLFTLTLAAADLAFLRRDLGDLRLVDASDVQVPFVAEPRAASERLALRLEPDPARRSRDSARGAVSRYLLLMPIQDGDPVSPPISTLELEVREPFFSRSFRLVDPAGGTRRGERVVAAATLTRGPGDEKKAPLVLPLDGLPHRELALEVEEGDDAPLTIERAQAVVAVPRLVFKAAPGEYRLLLEKPDAPPPHYDIASLRSEFLTYSASPVQLGPLARNPGYRRGVAERLRGVQGGPLLWGALGLSVVVLLLLTARILREPGAPP